MGAVAELPNYEVVALKYATRGRPISSAATRTMCRCRWITTSGWFAVMAPAKTPRRVVDKLHAALVKAVNAREVKEAMLKVGVEPLTHASPEAFSAFMREETVRWGKVAKDSGTRADRD